MQQKQKLPLLPVLKRVIALTQPYKKVFYLTIFVGLLIAPVMILRPMLIKKMVDDYIVPGDVGGLWQIALLTIGVIFLEVFLNFWFRYKSEWLGQAIIRRLRVRLFSHLTKMHLSFFNKTPIGTLTTRAVNDIATINNIFAQGLVTILSDLLTMIAVLAVMFYTSWRLALGVLLVFPFLLISTYVFKEGVRKAFEQVRQRITEMNAFLQEHISGIHLIKVFGKEEDELKKFKAINRDYTEANLNTITYYAIYFPVVELIAAVAIGLVVWMGTKGVLRGTETIGTLIAFPLFISMLFRPVRMLADKINTLQMGLIAARRVFALLDTEDRIPNTGNLKPEELKEDIVFEGVNFSYLPGHPVLKDINLTIKKGETTAFIGRTGSGKTTMAMLISRFYDPDDGRILIGRTDIRDFDLYALRRHIGVVLQDIFLFRGSILENIRMKDESISRQQVIEASRQIGAHKFFEQMPDGYEFEVMERGANLSVGQRQLISFVRALVQDPDILILDEATASIDPATEAVIQEAIARLTRERTSIVIAHRLSTIRNAEKIVVLEAGEIIETGNHDELMRQDSKYRKLYESQLISFSQ